MNHSTLSADASLAAVPHAGARPPGWPGRGRPRPGRARPRPFGFSGWAFEPQVVEANVKRFMAQYSGHCGEYTPLDLQLYEEKMVALFSANTQPDAFYVRDTALGAWVEAGGSSRSTA